MKKYAFLMVAGLLLVSGCGSKNEVVCTGSSSEDGMNLTMKVTATIKDEKVSAAKAVMTFDSKEMADAYCGIFNLASSLTEDGEKIDVKCDGKDVIFNDYSQFADSEDQIIGMSKEDFIKAMETSELSCK